jgi:hypothetical protein
MYSEDFYEPSYKSEPSNSSPTISMLGTLCQLIEFSKLNGLLELRHRAKRLRDRLKRCIQDGGPSGVWALIIFLLYFLNLVQVPSISRLSFALTAYDPISALIAGDEMALVSMMERARNFDISLENWWSKFVALF